MAEVAKSDCRSLPERTAGYPGQPGVGFSGEKGAGFESRIDGQIGKQRLLGGRTEPGEAKAVTLQFVVRLTGGAGRLSQLVVKGKGGGCAAVVHPSLQNIEMSAKAAIRPFIRSEVFIRVLHPPAGGHQVRIEPGNGEGNGLLCFCAVG